MNLPAELTAIVFLFCGWPTCGAVSSSFSQRRQQLGQASSRIGFTINNDLLDWHAAYKACKAQDYTLAFPKTPMEGEMLQSLLVDASDNTTTYKDVHLGLHSMFVPRHYLSVQGRGVDEYGFRQWDPQSQNVADQRCGAMTVDGMKTIYCDTRMESICQFKESRVSFDKIDGFGYYHFHDLSLNWTDAVHVCKLENANLLMLRSAAEYDAVFDYFTEEGFVNGTVDLLYGAHQLFVDHWFLTLGDEPLEESGYDVWAPGEPGDGTANEFPYVGLRLADLTAPDAEGGMFVLPPATPLWFICKRELH